MLCARAAQKQPYWNTKLTKMSQSRHICTNCSELFRLGSLQTPLVYSIEISRLFFRLFQIMITVLVLCFELISYIVRRLCFEPLFLKSSLPLWFPRGWCCRDVLREFRCGWSIDFNADCVLLKDSSHSHIVCHRRTNFNSVTSVIVEWIHLGP